MSARIYSHPYIMDISAVDDKLGVGLTRSIQDAIPRPKMIEIIREFVRLEAHCDDARALCSHNIGLIIEGETAKGYL